MGEAEPGPLDFQPVEPGKKYRRGRWYAFAEIADAAATDDAGRQIRALRERLQDNLARWRQPNGTRVEVELGERAVEIHQNDRSCVMRPRLPRGADALNSTHGTSHPALPAAR